MLYQATFLRHFDGADNIAGLLGRYQQVDIGGNGIVQVVVERAIVAGFHFSWWPVVQALGN